MTFSLSGFAQPAFITFASDVDWKVRESAHFRVLYPKGQSDLAKRTLNAAERAHKLLTPIFPESPDITWIVLADWFDSTNGYSINMPYPHMVIYPVPPGATGQLASLDDWLDSIVLHEYVHTLHLYPANGLWGILRSIFGAWVLPNGLMPTHFHEGMAVLMETEFTNGGRGTGAYFSMLQRMAVAEGKWGTDDFVSFDRMDGTRSVWPHGSSPYFFGYAFHKELWDRKGAKGIRALTESYGSNWPFFFYSGPLEEVYGEDYDSLWKTVFDKTQKRAQAEIKKIRSKPLSKQNFLTQNRYAKWDVALSPNKKRAAFRRSHHEEGNGIDILNVRTGNIEKRIGLQQTKAEGLCWGTVNGRELLFFIRPHREWGRHTHRLSQYDFASENITPLRTKPQSLQHVQRLACRPNLGKISTYVESGGKGSIVELAQRKDSNGLYWAPTRRWPVPTGSWVTSLLLEKGSSWFTLRSKEITVLYRWEPNADKPREVLRVNGHLFNLRTSQQKDRLFALGDLQGRNEIYAIHWKEKTIQKQVALVGGANAFDVLDSENGFLLSSYRHGGYDIAKANAVQSPAYSTKHFGSTQIPPPIAKTSMSAERNYSPWSTILPRMWVPTLLFVPDGFQAGFWIPAVDISQRHFYQLIGGYDSRGAVFGNAEYQYRFGGTYSLQTEVYYSPSYLQASRSFFKTWGGRISLSGFWNGPGIRWSLGPTYRQLEASAINSANQSVGIEASLYKEFDVRSRPYSVAPYWGTQISLSHDQFFQALGSDDNYFRSTASVTQYFPVLWAKTHSWILRFRIGYTEGTSISNAFFQGGGELLFYQTRNFFLNRGFLPGSFFGRQMAALNLEYVFPIINVEHGYGLVPFFLQTLHGGLVADVLTSGRGERHPQDRFHFDKKTFFHRYFGSVGLELKSDWKFFFYLPAELRMGVYYGLGPFGEKPYINFGTLAQLSF